MPIPTASAISTMSADILDVSVFVSGCSITANMTLFCRNVQYFMSMTYVYIQKKLQTVLRSLIVLVSLISRGIEKKVFLKRSMLTSIALDVLT